MICVEDISVTPVFPEMKTLVYTVGSFIMNTWGTYPSVLTTEVSSFQGVRIEEFHYIQRCPHLRGLE